MTYHYSVSVCWNKNHGTARYEGVSIQLRKRPQIEGLEYMESITYTPHAMLWRICPINESWREMTEKEIELTKNWVSNWAKEARLNAERKNV